MTVTREYCWPDQRLALFSIPELLASGISCVSEFHRLIDTSCPVFFALFQAPEEPEGHDYCPSHLVRQGADDRYPPLPQVVWAGLFTWPVGGYQQRGVCACTCVRGGWRPRSLQDQNTPGDRGQTAHGPGGLHVVSVRPSMSLTRLQRLQGQLLP